MGFQTHMNESEILNESNAAAQQQRLGDESRLNEGQFREFFINYIAKIIFIFYFLVKNKLFLRKLSKH